MTEILPIGYVTMLQAAEMLLGALYAGLPDLPSVKALREEQGMPVRDGPVTDRAIAEIWKAVDAGALTPMAVGGRPRRMVKLTPAFTKQVPTLRNPRGRAFTFLRQSNLAYHELVGYFGHDISNVSIVFRETEIQKLARRLMRARRAVLKSEGQKKSRGRPSRQEEVVSIVREVIERGKILNGAGNEGADTASEQKGQIRAAGQR
ncbi:MAG TPA: hypothetical protein VKB89_12845 [Xanthobacteraceae bacterium]|nr:hypothetical protein [Xanthobacteraceae bacterium]